MHNTDNNCPHKIINILIYCNFVKINFHSINVNKHKNKKTILFYKCQNYCSDWYQYNTYVLVGTYVPMFSYIVSKKRYFIVWI